MREVFVLFVWVGRWTIPHDAECLTERAARDLAADYSCPTRIRSMNAIVQALHLPDPSGEKPEDRCGWCGSTAGSAPRHEGDWPRCRDCQGC